METSITCRESQCLASDRIIGQPRVPLCCDDGSVPEDLLQCGEAAASFDPLARERVSQLMDMESRHSACPPHSLGERARRLPRVAHQATHAAPDLPLDFSR